MKQKHYNEALLILAQIMHDEPERFNDAAHLSNVIISTVRELYNRKYRELIDTIYQKRNPDKALQIIKEMEALDPNPNAEMQSLLETTKKEVGAVANYNHFNEVMNRALEMLKNNAVFDAIKTYLSLYSDSSSLDLGRSEFFESGYGNIVEAAVKQAADSVAATGDNVETILLDIKKDTDDLIAGFSSLDAKARETKVKSIFGKFKKIKEMGLAAEDASKIFRNQNDMLKKGVVNTRGLRYLKYSNEMIDGRETLSGKEGIFFAINSIPGSSVSDLIDGIGTYYFDQDKAGLESYAKELFTDASVSFGRAGEAAEILVVLSYYFDRGDVLSDELAFRYKKEWVVANGLTRFIEAQELERKAKMFSDISRMREKGLRYKNMTAKPSAETITSFAVDLRSMVTGIKDAVSIWSGYRKLSQTSNKLNYNPSNTDESIAFCSAAASSLLADYLRLLTLMFDDIRKRFDSETTLLANGIIDTKLGVVYYPNARYAALKKILDDSAFLDTNVGRAKSDWSKADDTLLKQKDMDQTLQNTDELAGNIATFIKSVKEQLAKAESNMTQAKKLKELGDLRYREALNELTRDNYATARDKVRETTDAYYQSLAYQEDSDLRNKLIPAVIAFIDQIQKTENERVVREVRKYIENAKNLYVRGEFEQSLDSLNIAQSRWNDTQTEENPEIKVWLAYVKSALSIKSERVLMEKNPLYKEMSQLYNLAKDDYNNALKLNQAGKKDQALALFQDAEDKLLKIILQFPYNKDARLLRLNITKETNNTDYRNEFAKRMNNARDILVSKTGDMRGAYNDLNDLLAIDPNYPGLKGIIYDYELALGLRLPPPDPAKIAQSNTLVEQARPIVEKRQIDLFESARNLLNQALALNTDNKAAKDLLDKMGIYSGAVTVPAAEIQKYGQAVQEYTNGKFLDAKVIMIDLKKRYPAYGPFTDLLNKINLALGQI